MLSVNPIHAGDQGAGTTGAARTADAAPKSTRSKRKHEALRAKVCPCQVLSVHFVHGKVWQDGH